MKNLRINSTIEDFSLEAEALSTVGQNPTFSWAKLVVCDDLPNSNNMRVPQEEFENLIKTGIFTPVKMAQGKISSHEEALGNAIGVITQMTKDGNAVKAIAAFWKRERDEDISYLKEMKESGELPQVSWEVSYDEMLSEIDKESGIINLRGLSLLGVAIVANPAYKGRTPIYDIASDKNGEKMKTIEELQAEIDEKDNLLQEKDRVIQEKETLITEQNEKITKLEEFKTSIEKEAENLTKLDSIKAKFVAAGITKEEKYFEDNKERLLKLEDSDIDFMIQEMLSFGKKESISEGDGAPTIPNFGTDDNRSKNPKNLAKALKEVNKIKKE